MEILRLLGLRGEQDRTARSSDLVENLVTWTTRRYNYIKVPRNYSNYLALPQDIQKYIEVLQKISLRLPRSFPAGG